MTVEEALKELGEWYAGFADKPSEEAIKTVMDEAGKQIPKKPTHDGIRPTCPTCHAPLPNVAHNNCLYCGQAIFYEVKKVKKEKA